MSPGERYQRDPVFRALVDTMRSQLRACQVTPSELREAVILAAQMHEAENVRPLGMDFMTRQAHCPVCDGTGRDPERWNLRCWRCGGATNVEDHSE